ncbi:S49 family peptidase [Dinoroseobacter sp. PD6]|uniref:S49 family peptidase n=1 Tax=Dinoroseobacter sp. PD6 TaxID=3028384 RepID=UPI00237BD9B5|nr:S49 family peptidase [Dinoroseobacter sp. PD6]MDD9718358.1 S49 family peptidase [Dinoroseobacter sp. PD6]
MKRWLPFVKSDPTVAVVRLQGAIAATGRGMLNDQSVGPLLERAFTKGKPDAVALVINSPGGSPAQSSLIGARIRRLAEEKEVPVYAFVEDVAASGGYWIAAAADEIWLDATSIVGSIGVISASFGFHELMERQGIERRVYTAGKDKSLLDPFRPERPEDVERLKGLQAQLHETFKGHITARRGAKLPEDRDLYTGEVWIGQQGIDVGLADGIGHVAPVMKEKFGDKTRFRTYGPRRPLIGRFGFSVVDDTLHALEARGLWARYGL